MNATDNICEVCGKPGIFGSLPKNIFTAPLDTGRWFRGTDRPVWMHYRCIKEAPRLNGTVSTKELRFRQSKLRLISCKMTLTGEPEAESK